MTSGSAVANKGLSLLWPELLPAEALEALEGGQELSLGSDPGQFQTLQLQSVPPESEFSSVAVDGLIDDAARQYLEANIDGGSESNADADPQGSTTLSGPVRVPPRIIQQGGPAKVGLQTPQPAGGGPSEPKGALNHYCQKKCRRPINKNDVVYTIMPQGPGRWQATVRLNCMNGQEFAGELRQQQKDAEKSAAEQALKYFGAGGTATVTPQSVVPPPVRVPPPAHAPAPAHVPPPAHMVFAKSQAPSSAPATVQPPSTALAIVQPPSLPLAGSSSVGLPSAGLQATPELGGANAKANLNMALGRLVPRMLQKEDAIYETVSTRMGFVCSLRMPCLPGDWGLNVFQGKPTHKKKDAETSAASIALNAILSDPALKAAATAPRTSSQWGARAGGKYGIKAQQEKLTSAAPKTLLSVCLDGSATALAAIDISPATSLASVRASIAQNRYSGVPGSYLFASNGIPVAREQEGVMLARDFLPQVMILSEDLRGAAGRKRPAERSPSRSRLVLKPRPGADRDGDRDGDRRGRR
mmetsp:Transcript_88797/g.197327  ORF Transcript_88797/g.197327 Transcript_88797/m.197327 type:complete len:528 (+) Transcript_88797:105-1688(+)